MKLKIIIIIILLIIVVGSSLWFYQDYQKTQANVEKIETILIEQGFENFYEKQGNKFYALENIIDDMLWVLENENIDVRKIEKIKNKNNKTGILIK